MSQTNLFKRVWRSLTVKRSLPRLEKSHRYRLCIALNFVFLIGFRTVNSLSIAVLVIRLVAVSCETELRPKMDKWFAICRGDTTKIYLRNLEHWLDGCNWQTRALFCSQSRTRSTIAKVFGWNTRNFSRLLWKQIQQPWEILVQS